MIPAQTDQQQSISDQSIRLRNSRHWFITTSFLLGYFLLGYFLPAERCQLESDAWVECRRLLHLPLAQPPPPPPPHQPQAPLLPPSHPYLFCTGTVNVWDYPPSRPHVQSVWGVHPLPFPTPSTVFLSSCHSYRPEMFRRVPCSVIVSSVLSSPHCSVFVHLLCHRPLLCLRSPALSSSSHRPLALSSALSSSPLALSSLCHRPPALSSSPYTVIVLSSSPCTVIALSSLCHSPTALSSPPVLSSPPCSVIVSFALSSSPCTVIALSLLCHRPPVLSSPPAPSSCPLLCHRPPALPSFLSSSICSVIVSVIVPLLCHRFCHRPTALSSFLS